jgi:glycosyltransferase involved in cell wall biosynthesis
MAADPLVSVVIPVRDGERFLAEAIDSVLTQTEPSVEVIVVEDGSRDASAEIASAYGPPVTCMSIEPRGVGFARTVGIGAARGEFIAFIDADDLWPPDRLEKQLEAMRTATPRPDIVFGHEVQFPPEGTGPRAARNTTTALVRRSTFERVGPFATEWVLGEFLEWLIRAREVGISEVMLPDVVSHRRKHGGNLTIKQRAAYGDYAKILGQALARRRGAASK